MRDERRREADTHIFSSTSAGSVSGQRTMTHSQPASSMPLLTSAAKVLTCPYMLLPAEEDEKDEKNAHAAVHVFGMIGLWRITYDLSLQAPETNRVAPGEVQHRSTRFSIARTTNGDRSLLVDDTPAGVFRHARPMLSAGDDISHPVRGISCLTESKRCYRRPRLQKTDAREQRESRRIRHRNVVTCT